MVPAVDPIAARMRGQIDPSMIGELKTKRRKEMALARMLKQGELPDAFNLGADETRFQPPVGGGAPVAVATGRPKSLPSPFAAINPKDFTPDSLTAAIKPDGTIDRTKLVAITQPRTGQLGVYDEYLKQEEEAGRVPKSIDKFITDQKIAGRTPAVAKEIMGRQQDEKTMRVYVAASNGLLTGLEGATSGPFVGMIPPFTAAQQTAEGSVAALAPVLKQMFRSAGEGVFTDKDQELLMKMVPTRQDLPEARHAKIDNIDNIISKKLGVPLPYRSWREKKQLQKAAGAAPQGVDPKLWAVMTPEERKAWK
jgi:hypothetical protein